MKIPVSERLPDYTDFVWVWRADSDKAELCYFIQRTEFEQWQDPYSVGDYEGLSIEHYKDVTHWAPLEPPTV
jgi:hypothetical protein